MAVGTIVGWVKAHKIAVIAGTVTIALVVAGGITVSSAIATADARAAEDAAFAQQADGWDAAKTDFDAAVAERDAAIEKTAAARTAGVTNLAQAKTAFDAAAAANVDVKELRTVVGNIDDLLTNDTFGITGGDDAHVVLTPEVPSTKPTLPKNPDTDEKKTYTDALAADIVTFAEATEAVEGQTKNIETFIETVTGESIAESYLAVAPAVVTYATDAGAADADAALQAAIDAKMVSAQNLVDTFNAVTALQSSMLVVTPETPGSPSHPSNPSTPSTPSNPKPPVNPPAPPVPESPVTPPAPIDPPSMSTNAAEGASGNCFAVGTASTTGGYIGAPSGVTNYTKSWDGSRWNIVWYSCL
ncbi:hypothetical protein [Microbacterium sp. UBA3486]|uniref:hypothetical protein n=1 Tax=Microbacterium TaxID=33882 RepID=UPI0025F99FFC|nr:MULTISPECIES: hypothetical protein [Microbacterium]